MDIDNEKNSICSLNEHECRCDDKNSTEKDCSEDQSNEGCGCGCGCGCGDGPGNQYITIVLEDDSELECQVLGIFGCDSHTYIALLNPIEDTVLLFRYILNPDRTIGIEDIVDDEEYDMVSKLFVAMHESQYEIVE